MSDAREFWELTIRIQGPGEPPPEDAVKDVAEQAYEDLGGFGASVRVEQIVARDDDEPCPACVARANVDPWIRARALGGGDD